MFPGRYINWSLVIGLGFIIVGCALVGHNVYDGITVNLAQHYFNRLNSILARIIITGNYLPLINHTFTPVQNHHVNILQFFYGFSQNHSQLIVAWHSIFGIGQLPGVDTASLLQAFPNAAAFINSPTFVGQLDAIVNAGQLGVQPAIPGALTPSINPYEHMNGNSGPRPFPGG